MTAVTMMSSRVCTQLSFPPIYTLEVLNKIIFMLPSLQHFSLGIYSICGAITLFRDFFFLFFFCVWLSYTIVYCFKTAWTLLYILVMEQNIHEEINDFKRC